MEVAVVVECCGVEPLCWALAWQERRLTTPLESGPPPNISAAVAAVAAAADTVMKETPGCYHSHSHLQLAAVEVAVEEMF